MTRISLVSCTTYDEEILYSCVSDCLALLDFNLSDLKNARVGVKPNLLTSSPPGKAIVTHPNIFRVICRIVRESGGVPVLIESPAVQPLNRVLKKTGYMDIISEDGIEVADTEKTALLRSDRAVQYKSFEVIAELFNVDFIINLPKLKTHRLTHMTGAVKNLFGTVPGMRKARCHMKARTPDCFSGLLLDLYACILTGFERPVPMLHLMDAVTAMEGEGPGASGNPRHVGLLIAGTDAVAVDRVAAEITGLDWGKIDTVKMGGERNLGEADPDRIDIAGADLKEHIMTDFKVPGTSAGSSLMGMTFGSGIIRQLLIEKPVPDSHACTLCYQCMRICPAGAISESINKKTPRFDLSRCIRCYCCMEVCPEAAITVKPGRLQWIMDLAGG